MAVSVKALKKGMQESELWLMLQSVIASGEELDDELIDRLDDRMRGYLFLQDHVMNREARIEFARSPQHMDYLRDAAGSRNVWMDDREFAELVLLDDSISLACFARSEQMKPHHLAYISHKLAIDPHGHELLASADDARISQIKAVEIQGASRELEWMKQAIEESASERPFQAWQRYLVLSQQNSGLVGSSSSPERSSAADARILH